MSLVAVGAYLRALRESVGLTRAQVAEAVQSHETHLARLERGLIDTRGSVLFALVRSVGGDLADVDQLLRSEDATAAEGRALATARRADPSRALAGRLDEGLLQVAARLEGDARRTGQWVGYGERLAEEREARATLLTPRAGRRRGRRRG